MFKEDKYFRELTEAELWQRYCGFLDLSVDEFMELQEKLLIDQIKQVAGSTLGGKIIPDGKVKNMSDFRSTVPITTYADYEPYLSERRDDALADKPVFWCHSSGIGGYYKWVPWNEESMLAATTRLVTIMILASARRKGEVNISPGMRMLLHMAPPPYISGTAMGWIEKNSFTYRTIPPLEETTKMEFPDRIAKGFNIALRSGVDEIFSIASVLVKVGEEMSLHARKMKFSWSMLHPSVLLRVARALLISKIARRPMLPKDLWPAKAILTIGTDTSIYKADITRYWGQIPYEIYGGTEVFPLAINAWNKKWLTFEPTAAFYEFLPEEEQRKCNNNPGYQPQTVLMNQVEVGKSYEVIISQLRGMPLLRYKLGDIVTAVALADEEAGINLPQFKFKCRADEIITLAGLCRLDEKTLWQAIVAAGVKYEDWTARKEHVQGQAYLHIYLEPKDSCDALGLEKEIDARLKVIDIDYKDVGDQLGMQPVRVTLLSKGTFTRYLNEKRKAGADLAHTKPRHINASDEVVQRLITLSGEGV